MQIILDQGEAWSLMTLVTSFVIDNSGVSQEGKQTLRRWRSERSEGSQEMQALADGMNKALGGFMDEQTNRQVRQKGRYITKKARKG
jgi:UPF0716 family protein affecting phage T7 exclusion